MAEPTTGIGRKVMANIILLTGDSGAKGDLPVIRTINEAGAPAFVSCWKLSLRERFFAAIRGKVWLMLMGDSHPPVWVGGESPLEPAKNS